MRSFVSMLLWLAAMGCYAADASTIVVHTGSPQFVVSLPANPTTGFQWTVSSYDTSKFKLKGAQYTHKATKLIGAGGTMTFTFALIKGQTYPKSTTMSFSYGRSWDAKSAHPKVLTIQFTPNA